MVNANVVTTVRVANGLFEVYCDGVKTEWTISNGSCGVSGYGRNIYVIHKIGTSVYKQIGSLARCKKTIALTLRQTAGQIAR